MRGRIVFLLEEPSMKILLEGLLPRLFPGMCAGRHFLCLPHEGRSDLDVSIPRKLRNWQVPDDRFVILRDNDNACCVDLKARFVRMCLDNGRPDTLVRLVCQELESWYLGDLQALAEAFADPRLASPGNRKRYLEPDAWQKPAAELARLIHTFQKGGAARTMAQTLSPEANRSPSFQTFIAGLRRLAGEMGYAATE